MLCKQGSWEENGVEGTSSGCCELGPADEPKVSRPGPESLSSISEAQAGVEMISLKSLAIVDGIVATGCMGAVHPDLQERKGDDSGLLLFENLIFRLKTQAQQYVADIDLHQL